MAQAGFTPIQLYFSTTAAAVPTSGNLASGELAINIVDEKLYFKNSAGTVKLLASNATSAPVLSFQTSLSGLTPSTATTGVVTLAGVLGTSSGGTNLTSFTANGVVYASSSSALATGSALVFDGTNFGVGTASPSAKVDFVTNSNSGTAVQLSLRNTSNGTNVSAGIAFGFNTVSADPDVLATIYGLVTDRTTRNGALTFSTAASGTNTERMRITSAGDLLLGTTASGYGKLTVLNPTGVSAFFSNSTYLDQYLKFTEGTGYTIEANYGLTFNVNTLNAAYPMKFSMGGTERARIDSSGNFMVGTTTIGAGNRMKVVGNNVVFTPNTDAYNTHTFSTGVADVGSYAIANVATTTVFLNAGGSSYFTGGNLGVGATSPFSQGSDPRSIEISGTNYGQLYVTATASLARGGFLASSGDSVYLTSITNHPLRFGTNDTERARIDTSGNLLVGTTTSSGAKQTIYGSSEGQTIYQNSSTGTGAGNGFYVGISGLNALVYNYEAGNLIFATNATERARIDSSGNFMIGTTSPATQLTVYAGSGTVGLTIQSGSSYGYYLNNGTFISIASNVGTTGLKFKVAVSAPDDSAIIDSSGNLTVPAKIFTSQINGDGTNDFAFLSNNASKGIIFYTGVGGVSAVERARIDSSGNLLVGATAVGNGGKLYVNGSISLGTSTTGTQSSMAKDTTQLTSSVSTSATTIYTDISSGMSSASAGYFIIYGHNNSGAGFMDVVVASSNRSAVVVSSSTVEGSPPARTYSVSSFALQLAMASGTFNVNLKATVLGFPF
jgi:hypothetical protein